jgi:hypothetical protein
MEVLQASRVSSACSGCTVFAISNDAVRGAGIGRPRHCVSLGSCFRFTGALIIGFLSARQIQPPVPVLGDAALVLNSSWCKLLRLLRPRKNCPRNLNYVDIVYISQ